MICNVLKTIDYCSFVGLFVCLLVCFFLNEVADVMSPSSATGVC